MERKIAPRELGAGIAEWLPLIDAHLSDEYASIPERPLKAASLVVELAIEIRGDRRARPLG